VSTDLGAIELENVSLCYRLAKQRPPSFKDYALHWVRGALTHEQLWALTDVSLRVAPGERVAIIGRNGAGKSSLLKVIAGVLKPTAGRLAVGGRIAPILELGTGFDYELSGTENIYLNALLLGHSRREIDERFDEIVDFSGLGDFIRAPVRNYSSGMLARLGFAIVTAWMPSVLILDEFMAVGDVAFLKKCQARLQRFWDAGTTLLLVSHLSDAVLRNCTRAIWLEAGRVLDDGPADRVMARYTETATETDIRPA
jgi:ABC-2 type transport system ATP-binding protein